MRNQQVYDLPIRIFHWIFSTLFVAAFMIAKTIDDESANFSYHMLAGLLLGFTIMLRIIWGFVGSKYSRFSSFALKPQDLFSYFRNILSGEKKKWAGHNPASSWATLAMLGFGLALGVTGYLMTSGQKETFEDVHELLANGFLITVLLHIAGVILHSIRHRDVIALSMVDGAKSGLNQNETISNSRPVFALVFVGLIALFALYLGRNFNPANQTINLFGNTLQLGENENDELDQNEGVESKDKDDDDD